MNLCVCIDYHEDMRAGVSFFPPSRCPAQRPAGHFSAQPSRFLQCNPEFT